MKLELEASATPLQTPDFPGVTHERESPDAVQHNWDPELPQVTMS